MASRASKANLEDFNKGTAEAVSLAETMAHAQRIMGIPSERERIVEAHDRKIRGEKVIHENTKEGLQQENPCFQMSLEWCSRTCKFNIRPVHWLYKPPSKGSTPQLRWEFQQIIFNKFFKEPSEQLKDDREYREFLLSRSVGFFTEFFWNKHMYRAHSNYKSIGEWYDWAYIPCPNGGRDIRYDGCLAPPTGSQRTDCHGRSGKTKRTNVVRDIIDKGKAGPGSRAVHSTSQARGRGQKNSRGNKRRRTQSPQVGVGEYRLASDRPKALRQRNWIEEELDKDCNYVPAKIIHFFKVSDHADTYCIVHACAPRTMKEEEMSGHLIESWRLQCREKFVQYEGAGKKDETIFLRAWKEEPYYNIVPAKQLLRPVEVYEERPGIHEYKDLCPSQHHVLALLPLRESPTCCWSRV